MKGMPHKEFRHCDSTGPWYLEGDILVCDGTPYCDRRMGITWPGPMNPGYYCIFGLEDWLDPVSHERRLVLLAEKEVPNNLDEFFSAFRNACVVYSAWNVYALGTGAREFYFDAYSVYAKKMGAWASNIRLNDISDLSSFEAGRSIASNRAKKRALVVPKGTVLRGQMEAVTPENCRTSEGMDPITRWYAAAAMNHVLVSHDFYPWVRPENHKPLYDRRNGEGYR